MRKSIIQSLIGGVAAALALVAAYFVVVSLVSGFAFAENQFATFWYYLGSLALGFGIQIGLYLYLKQLVHAGGGRKVLALTGTTSTAAMISCCAHYLVNILPVLGVSAFASLVGEYQIQFFWVGIVFNLTGIGFMVQRILKIKNILP